MRPTLFSPFDQDLFENLRCIPVVGSAWKEQVRKVLGTYRSLPSVLDSILDIAQSELKAKTVLIEPYISTDWADEYQAFYCRLFRDLPRLSTRLHFFRGIGEHGKPLEKKYLLDLPEECTRLESSAYLGYCVVRPFEPLTVTDTVLASPYRRDRLDSVHCQPDFHTHLVGHELHVRGMPFIEQEQGVSVCAEANLWMVARYMHATSNARRFRPSEMAEIATRYLGVGTVRAGLTSTQMFGALKAMGMNPELIYPKNAEDALELLYSCVESEIPVIAAIPGHVVTVIGRSYGSGRNGFALPDSVAGFVDAFVVHDDQMGPYRTLPVRKRLTKKKVGPHSQLILGNEPVEWCLVPMPSSRINLRESDVRGMLGTYLKKGTLLNLLKSVSGNAKLWKKSELSNLLWRIYLRRSDTFKKDIFPPANDPRWSSDLVWRGEDVVVLYWSMLLPRYVWVVELSDKKIGYSKDASARRIIGEMVFDSTAHLDDFLNSLLAMQVKGRMIFRGAAKHVDKQIGDARNWHYAQGLAHHEYSPLVRYY